MNWGMGTRGRGGRTRLPMTVVAGFAGAASLALAGGASPFFTNIATPGSLLESLGGGRGTLVMDYDNDGDSDLFVASSVVPNEPGQQVPPPVILLRNDGGGTLTDVTIEAGLSPDWRLATFGITAADVNNDGWLDLFTATGGKQTGRPRDVLYINYGGTFVDETEARGIFPRPAQSFVGVWIDADNDGWVDLLNVGYNLTPSRFYKNVGGTFVDATVAAGIDQIGLIFGQGASTGDVNRDGWLDIYIPTTGQNKNVLLINQGGTGFVDMAAEYGVADTPVSAFASSIVDVNHDGWPELFSAGYSDISSDPLPEVSRVYVNAPTVDPQQRRFVDVTFQTQMFHGRNKQGAPIGGGAMGLQTGDFDLDGWIDVYIGNGGPFPDQEEKDKLFWNRPLGDGRWRFQDVTDSLINPFTGDSSNTHMTHGVAFFDFDDDGDIDIYANSGGPGVWAQQPGVGAQANTMWRNEIGQENNFIRIVLEGSGDGATNRAAIGSRIQVSAPTAAPVLTQFRDVKGAAGFGQQNSLWTTVGLGPHLDCDIQIQWTTGQVVTFENVDANQTVKIVEGEGLTVISAAPAP